MIIVPIGSDLREHEKRSPGRPKSVDRQATIALAMDNYWREGVRTLSLNELCRRSRISKPALYREFGDEDGLMQAVLTHYRALVLTPVLDALAMELRFPELMDTLIVGMTTERGTPAGCLFTEMRLARSRLGPRTVASLATMETERRQAFRDWFQQGLQRDEVDATLSAESAARYIDTQFTTVLLQLGMGEPPEQVREQARLALGVLHSGCARGD